MATTFKVISLGKHKKIDVREHDGYDAERAYKLVGKEMGSEEAPLWSQVKTMTPSDTKDEGGWWGVTAQYDQNNSEENGFHLDGGPEQTFDAVAVYDATLTYDDGTTAKISAVVFQDTEGQTYLAPELSENADHAALEAKPIVTLELNALLVKVTYGMGEDRAVTDFKAPCFTPGTRITVPGGHRRVEDLRIGDRVLTQDHGAQPVRWVRQVLVPGQGTGRPVRIRAGALGEGCPQRDLCVSPNHRMLVRSKIATRMTGVPEVLVPAKRLLGLPGIGLDRPCPALRYIHFRLDRHEIVFANGAPTETLLPGPMVQRWMGAGSDRPAPGQTPARPVPKGHVIRRMVHRHRLNRQPLLQTAPHGTTGPARHT